MAIVAIIGDTHFGASNSNDFFLQYQEGFFRELIPVLKENNVTDFIHLGDVYDIRKAINYKTLKKTHKFFTEILQESGFNIHLIVGNHDSYYKSSLEINAVRELLGWTGFNIYDAPEEISIDSSKFLMVPWICPDNQEKCLSMIDNSLADVCCGHFDISGFYMMKNVINQSGLASSLFDKFKRTFSGHFHIPSNHSKIIYVGSPYELSWNDYNDLKRTVLYDTETDKITFLENHETIFEKVFYGEKSSIKILEETDFSNKILKVYVDQKNNGYEFDLFLKKIKDSNPHLLTVVENVNIVEDEQIHEFIKKDTLEFLTEYIDESELENGYDLKMLMGELYNQAQEIK